jgi:protein gp37
MAPMSGKSPIEWTEQTWNPIVGCSILSPGCTHCYAMAMAARIEAMNAEAREADQVTGKRRRTAEHYDGTTRKVNGHAVWTGKLALAGDNVLLAPLKRKKPTTYFVNSMGDLFHEDVPYEWIDKVFAVMALCPQHTFQVLTKRAKRMRAYMTRGGPTLQTIAEMAPVGRGVMTANTDWPLPNVWLGVSAERQQEWDERKEHLRQTPAAVRFASFEPLLGSIIELDPISDYLHWAIVGGESGPSSRPMHPEWARYLRDACTKARVPFFLKQWGEYLPVGQSLPGYGKIHGATAVKPGRMKLHYGGTPEHAPKHAFAERGVDFASMADGRLTFRVGKKAAGRLLDGVEHNGFPKVPA